MSSKKYLPAPESYREFQETGPRAEREAVVAVKDTTQLPTYHSLQEILTQLQNDKS